MTSDAELGRITANLEVARSRLNSVYAALVAFQESDLQSAGVWDTPPTGESASPILVLEDTLSALVEPLKELLSDVLMELPREVILPVTIVDTLRIAARLEAVSSQILEVLDYTYRKNKFLSFDECIVLKQRSEFYGLKSLIVELSLSMHIH